VDEPIIKIKYGRSNAIKSKQLVLLTASLEKRKAEKIFLKCLLSAEVAIRADIAQ
jgi:hypothetical protein